MIDDLMKKVPQKVHLVKLFSSAAAHWKTIGDHLEVNHQDLDMQTGGTAQNNLSTIFDRWLNKYEDVTWKAISDMCRENADELGIVKAKVRDFLASDKAHDKYLDTPDFNG